MAPEQVLTCPPELCLISATAIVQSLDIDELLDSLAVCRHEIRELDADTTPRTVASHDGRTDDRGKRRGELEADVERTSDWIVFGEFKIGTL